MKDQLFTIALFAGTFISARAQNTAGVKFIDNIEIVPGSYSGESTTESPSIKTPSKKTATVWVAPVVTTASTIEKCSALQFKYAVILDKEVELLTNTKLYSFIDEWMNTRYHYGGTTEDGIDCSAFSSTLENNVYKQTIPRTAKDQYNACSKIEREELQEGDLVFFNTRGGVSHVGVYLCNGYFVHSSTNEGVTISNLNEGYYNKKFIGGGRVVLINN